jgi:pimeloyl-ACP methyl ester carboxylesterase
VKRRYTGLAALGAVTAGAAAANIYIARKSPTLENELGGHERTYRWRFGDVFYTAEGQGDPLLFVHGAYAGASNFEWRKNFHALSGNHTVYALDLLGFGLSDKPSVSYHGELYVQLIADFILDVIGRPAAVAGSSHGGAYAIAAADKHRLIINRLILSCPTGIDQSEIERPMSLGLNAALTLPVIGKSVYYGLTSWRGIESYLKSQVYSHPRLVTPQIAQHYYDAAHQPHADRAVRAFVAGDLNLSVRERFAALRQPVTVIWGAQARITGPEIAQEFKKTNADARVEVLSAAAQLPHEEQSAAWNKIAAELLESPPEGATAPPHEHTKAGKRE